MNLSPSARTWLRYGLGGLLPIWLLDSILLPRLLPFTPVLMLVCVTAVSVLEGSVFGAQFGLLTGFLWATAYPMASPGRILLLTFIGMVSGAVSQYALRRSLLGCVVCTAGAMAFLSCLNILRGFVTGLAPTGALLTVAIGESMFSLLVTPPVYLLFSRLSKGPGHPRS